MGTEGIFLLIIYLLESQAINNPTKLKMMTYFENVIECTGWKGYARLNSEGYRHMKVRQFADIGENLLPLTNRVTSLLKSWLQGTHQGAIRASHLDYYLDEYTFRFNQRTSRSRGKLFYRLVQQAVAVAPVKGQGIQGGSYCQ